MIIEFTNAREPKNHSTMGIAFVITACALFFIPTTLIILGYYSTKPTGTLISPLPQDVLGLTAPSVAPENQAVIASDNTATETADHNITPDTGNNIIDKVAVIKAGLQETIIEDKDINPDTLIYLSPKDGDSSLYSVKSKEVGRFTISAKESSVDDRYIDYHLVNP